MSDSPPNSEPSARPARTWGLGGVALAAVALITIIAINQNSGDTVDDVTGDDVTAWQSRIAMEQVMTETATTIGLTVQPRKADDEPLACDRAGGGEGFSFLVRGFEGPTIEDLDASLAQVRAAWEGQGLVVHNRAIGDKKGLSTTLPDGGSFYMLSGSDVTIFAGESACARTVGAPTEAASN